MSRGNWQAVHDDRLQENTRMLDRMPVLDARNRGARGSVDGIADAPPRPGGWRTASRAAALRRWTTYSSSGPASGGNSREGEVVEMSWAMQRLAIELRCPVVVAVQRNSNAAGDCWRCRFPLPGTFPSRSPLAGLACGDGEWHDGRGSRTEPAPAAALRLCDFCDWRKIQSQPRGGSAGTRCDRLLQMEGLYARE
jgi:hypothetical protein